MTTIVEWQKVEGEQVAKFLQDAREKLTGSEGEIVLDFSQVQRINPAGLLAFEELAAAAGDRSVKIKLRSVNVGVYKVLKLARLTSQFDFVD